VANIRRLRLLRRIQSVRGSRRLEVDQSVRGKCSLLLKPRRQFAPRRFSRLGRTVLHQLLERRRQSCCTI